MWRLFRNSKFSETVRCAAYTDVGNRPGRNQDSFFAQTGNDISVFCVADGMGGHTRGELASEEIVENIKIWCNGLREPSEISLSYLFDDFEKTIESANSIIYNKYNRDDVCGSTVAAMVIRGEKFCIISAGDSRIYRRDGNKMRQITRDDVWLGRDPSEESETDRGKLIKAVGVSKKLICNRITGEIQRKEIFFLCSDGIYKVVGDKFIDRLPRLLSGAKEETDIERVLKSVHAYVDECGAPDNNTGIIVKI